MIGRGARCCGRTETESKCNHICMFCFCTGMLHRGVPASEIILLLRFALVAQQCRIPFSFLSSQFKHVDCYVRASGWHCQWRLAAGPRSSWTGPPTNRSLTSGNASKRVVVLVEVKTWKHGASETPSP